MTRVTAPPPAVAPAAPRGASAGSRSPESAAGFGAVLQNAVSREHGAPDHTRTREQGPRAHAAAGENGPRDSGNADVHRPADHAGEHGHGDQLADRAPSGVDSRSVDAGTDAAAPPTEPDPAPDAAPPAGALPVLPEALPFLAAVQASAAAPVAQPVAGPAAAEVEVARDAPASVPDTTAAALPLSPIGAPAAAAGGAPVAGLADAATPAVPVGPAVPVAPAAQTSRAVGTSPSAPSSPFAEDDAGARAVLPGAAPHPGTYGAGTPDAESPAPAEPSAAPGLAPLDRAAELAPDAAPAPVPPASTIPAAPAAPVPAESSSLAALGVAGPAGSQAPPAASPAVPAPTAAPPPQPLPQQLAAPILDLRTAAPGEHIITVRVAPENLGPVTVRAQVSADGMSVELFAPTDQARDALKTILADLRRDLAQSGPGTSVGLGAGDAGAGSRGGRREQPPPPFPAFANAGPAVPARAARAADPRSVLDVLA